MRMSRTAILLCVGALFASPAHAQPLATDRTATHVLGFSGATLSIRQNFLTARWPTAEQTFILKGADGETRTLQLNKGGGTAGNNSFNLFRSLGDNFLLVSEKDCVVFDPVSVSAAMCAQRPPCANSKVQDAVYLGRFDWMNGIDPPRGVFRLDFRFLPFEDAEEGGACPRK